MDLMARLFSPYDLGPAGSNPLERILATASTSIGWRARRSSSSSPQPTCARAAGGSSATPTSRRRCCWPRPACRRCSRPSRSTARPIGTAATPAIPPLRRWCASATRRTPSWSQINPIERPGTPRTAREILQPAQRDLLQRGADQGTANDGAAAAGRRPGHTARARRWAEMRIHRIVSDMMIDLGYSSKMQRRVGLLLHAARRGARAAERVPRRHGTDVGPAPSSTSTRCSRESDAVGLLGILLGAGSADVACRSAAGASCCSRRPRPAGRCVLGGAAARALDADLHARRGGLHRAVLPAVPARRPVRQADGGQRLCGGHRALHDGRLGRARAILAVVLAGAS